MLFFIQNILKITLLLFSGHSFAAGFQLFEGNAINIGDFGAGGGANLKDASAAYFNPAALSNLPCRHQVVLAGTGVFKSSHFNGDVNTQTIDRSNNGSRAYIDNFSKTDTSIRSSGNSFIPAIFYGASISKEFAFGIGVSVPFGLFTDWGQESDLRYSATKTKIVTYNLGPSFSYKFNKYFALGGGVDIQYISAELNSAIATPTVLGIAGDSYSNNSAHGTGVGGNIGILVSPLDGLDISVHYRSRIDHSISGKSKFNGALAPNGERSSEVSTRVTMPDMFSFNSAYSVNNRVKVMAGAYYTLWSTINSITMRNIASASNPVTETIPLNFNNTWRFVAGSEVKISDKALVRGGVGFDQSIVNTNNRSIRSPDNDRIAFALGAQYMINKSFYVDLGYTHIFIKKADIDHTLETFNQRATVNGKAKNHVDLVSLQVTANIC